MAWLRVDTQTILTIHNHLITKSSRISITHSESKTWYLHIRDVQEHDRGWYMCQINTDPMKSQVAYLDIVGKSISWYANYCCNFTLNIIQLFLLLFSIKNLISYIFTN